jgi:hypothetical protein
VEWKYTSYADTLLNYDVRALNFTNVRSNETLIKQRSFYSKEVTNKCQNSADDKVITSILAIFIWNEVLQIYVCVAQLKECALKG